MSTWRRRVDEAGGRRNSRYHHPVEDAERAELQREQIETARRRALIGSTDAAARMRERLKGKGLPAP